MRSTHTSKLSAENQLLLCVARRSLDAAASEKIRAILTGGDIEWNYLSAAAVAHGVAALLAYHVQAAGKELVPSSVLSDLQLQNQQCIEHYLFLTGQLAKVVSALDEDGVRSVAFKGPTLTLVAYGEGALRQFADLDILIHEGDINRAKQTLIKHGFAPFSVLDAGREAALLRFDNAYAFANDHEVIVDIHWRFAPLYFSLLGNTEDFWERVEPLQIGGQTVMTLSAEDLLLVLCCHGFTHEWQRLVWICDVASLIEQRNLNWDYALEEAKRQGVLRIVLVGLFLARELGADNLPTEVINRLDSDRAVKRFAEQRIEKIFELEESNVGALEWLRTQISLRERMRDKATSLLRLMFTPRDYDWRVVSVPPSLSLLYYWVRPIRMVRQRLQSSS